MTEPENATQVAREKVNSLIALAQVYGGVKNLLKASYEDAGTVYSAEEINDVTERLEAALRARTTPTEISFPIALHAFIAKADEESKDRVLPRTSRYYQQAGSHGGAAASAA
ncbi:MAG TPA: hypothetical protein VF829_00880 [Candidatus Paceibacterota bacterium]